MTVQELCEKIDLQDCMKKGVCEFVSSYDFTEVEDILDGLTHAQKAEEAYENLMKEIYNLVPQGLCGAVYTQVSDIEEEINGLFTYDRKVCKVDIAEE